MLCGNYPTLMANELILIVEDNEKNRKLIRDLLQAKGYETIESESAEQGLILAEERQPALILMDIQLAGMDGISALKQLKASAPTRSIPVMAITASAIVPNAFAGRTGSMLTAPKNRRGALGDAGVSGRAPLSLSDRLPRFRFRRLCAWTARSARPRGAPRRP